MRESFPDNFELRMRIDSMHSEPDAISAVAETWEFMTGKTMPATLPMELMTTLEGKVRPINPWELKLLYEATGLTRLSAYARMFYRDRYTLKGDPSVLVSAAEELNFAESSPYITELIRKLGEEILDTAYLALGSDVEDQITALLGELVDEMPERERLRLILEKFDELFKAHLALDQDKAVPKDGFKDETNRTINHILKLSPHHLKSIEDNTLLPTCLSMSIIMASFLKKCGITEIFHVGVVTPVDWPYAVMVAEIAESVDAYATTHGVPYPDNVSRMIRKRQKSAEKTASDWDPHSALVFNSGTEYVLCDPYQNVSVYLGKKAEKDFAEIAGLHAVQPALEVLYNPDADLTHVEWAQAIWGTYLVQSEGVSASPHRWRTALHYAVEDGDVQPILDVLDSTTPSEADDFASFIMPSGIFGNRVHAHDFGEIEDIEELIKAMQDFAREESKAFIKESLAVQVFWQKEYSEEGILRGLLRCMSDERYFERRVEDLILWPQRMMLYGVQRAWHDVHNERTAIPHVTIEVGQIEHRIGACSLLDVSYGLGDDLPLSFWATQTSSQLPWLYAHQADTLKNESIIGQEVSERLKRVLEVSSWRYRQIVGII